MRFVFCIIIVSVLSACATSPKFQKLSGGQGYSARELDGHDHLMVDLNLPSGEQASFYRHYGMRAVGEECKARGFGFFNAATLSMGQYEGFCASANPKILGITYADAGLKQTPPSFVIETVADKPKTFVRSGDRVLELDGKKLAVNSDFLLASFRANKNGKATQHLKIERSGKTFEVDEPMAALGDSYMNSNDLEKLQAE